MKIDSKPNFKFYHLAIRCIAGNCTADSFLSRVKPWLLFTNNLKAYSVPKQGFLNAIQEVQVHFFTYTDAHHVTVIVTVSSQYSSKVLLNTCLSINGNLFQTNATSYLNNFLHAFFQVSSVCILDRFFPTIHKHSKMWKTLSS